ncbi:hypothetical protein PPTG_19629 [Phytophthora nicotianae INRA-310]|uniref:Uncharacterized protein n=1 Tax=Phytophthora nicotianae (strain INRA-310) TaxID=761204 RepID=W2PBY9_PHYN3|nr:hypothetical protein PPTG_02200 [Phytophthora nicotianae INRA-310]XP_008916374.1 hypothetical protein PPTG_19629 [Phytophthora nicotianae INRA-310]ETM98336.1 hypothetical protein PPTG_19629 [Phytophthora nicotianae INRA-310]ETN22184.1 hypothetical protein PPTG_02200 [Phytophthora nicotianae INRA-310]
MLISSAGNSFTVGGNHRIPIEDNGDVKMKITDTNQNEGEVNVLYATQLKLNLLCLLGQFEANTGETTRPYQF